MGDDNVINDVVAKAIYAHKQVLKNGDSIAILKSNAKLRATQLKIDSLYFLQSRIYNNATQRLNLNYNAQRSKLNSLLISATESILGTEAKRNVITDTSVKVKYSINYSKRFEEKEVYGMIKNNTNQVIEIILQYQKQKKKLGIPLTYNLKISPNEFVFLDELTAYFNNQLFISQLNLKYFIFYPTKGDNFKMIESANIILDSREQNPTIFIELIPSATENKSDLKLTTKAKIELIDKLTR